MYTQNSSAKSNVIASNKDKLRDWISELTDFTPQQVDEVITQLQEKQAPSTNIL